MGGNEYGYQTKDLLLVDEGRNAEIRLLIAVADRQSEQIGLPLRDLFFCNFRQMGLSDLSLEWLVALTTIISGFEYDVVDLILDWLSEVLDFRELPTCNTNFTISSEVNQQNNTNGSKNYRMKIIGFLREKEVLDEEVQKIFFRICCKIDHLTYEYLLLLDIILKYGHVPDNELHSSGLYGEISGKIKRNNFNVKSRKMKVKDLLLPVVDINMDIETSLTNDYFCEELSKAKVIGVVTTVALSL
ncbi:unnamed protein product [Dracunculus medinensis]|uniref:NPH3 domain-containing protein n=1 Tax=Dracunculus medinensis TaxID=318479 RepID=A0A0N4UNG2_DRAME|nr:unnamed protein product [Dracunculus medinensis]